MTDYESTADLNEQVYYESLDADILQAQYEAESAESAARYARGICGHNSRLGRKVPAFYSAEDIARDLVTARFGNRGGFEGPRRTFLRAGISARSAASWSTMTSRVRVRRQADGRFAVWVDGEARPRMMDLPTRAEANAWRDWFVANS